MRFLLIFVFTVMIYGSAFAADNIIMYYQKDGTLNLTNIPVAPEVTDYKITSNDKKIMLRRSREYIPYIREYAALYKVPEELVISVIMAESSFIPTAVSDAGACGLMQLTRNTAKHMGLNGDIFDPQGNIKAGVKYLHYLLTRFNDNMVKAVAAYNAGPGKIMQYRDVPPFIETQNFVKNVLNNYYELVKAKSSNKPATLYSQGPSHMSKLFIYYDSDGNLRLTDVKRD